jgi:glucokinase
MREAISKAAGAVPIVLAQLGDLVGVVGAGAVGHDLLAGMES